MKTGGQNSAISIVILKQLLPESLVVFTAGQGDEDSGNEIVVPRDPQSGTNAQACVQAGGECFKRSTISERNNCVY